MKSHSIKYTVKSKPKVARMTYILGVKCTDGVVLVGDRKVTYRENADVEFKPKLYSYYYPIVVGSSGSTFLFDKFREDALIIAQKYEDAISINDYMNDIRDKVRDYYKLYKNTLYPWDFDILFAAQTRDRGAILKHIYGGDALIEDVTRYRVIGSENGRILNSTLLEPLWPYKMTMRKAAEFGYFIIKYIERYYLDNFIGVGNKKPQIWFIHNTDKVDELQDESALNELENTTKTRIDNFESNLRGLFGI
jgi:20S proteasome alpha/beta subunit